MGSPSKKRRSTSKKAAAHPAYKDMIKAAIIGLKQRGGSSRQAIAKYIAGHYKVGDNANVHLRMAIKRALAGMLVTNASHSNTFRLAPEAKKVPKTPKKKVTAKKPAAKKTAKPKKKTAAKKKSTPKKAKKPATKTKKKTTTKKKP